MSFPNPQDMSLRLWLSLRWCLERSNYIKMGSLGRLTQSACFLNKERLGTDTNTQASSQESPAKTRGRPQKPALLALPSGSLGFQSGKRTYFLSFKPPALWYRVMAAMPTNTGLKFRNVPDISCLAARANQLPRSILCKSFME